MQKYTKHGLSKTTFNKKWYGIVKRCSNPRDPSFTNYGGVGIECEWISFEEFFNDMYKSYIAHVEIHGERQTTIDRINPLGNYSRENCRWATYSVQNLNKRNVTKFNHLNQTKSITEWSILYGLKPSIVFNRINRGWSFEKAINTHDTEGKHSYKYTRKRNK